MSPPWPIVQNNEMHDIFKKIKDAKDKEGGEIFVERILPMSVDGLQISRRTLII